MKKVYAVAAAVALLAGQAFAAETAPLAPGKPAGVKKAQDESMMALYVLGGAAVIAGIAVLASDNGDNNVAPTPPATSTST
jgi:hypothetical protein